jgi:16S rRNA (cytidine1402-2'-O)-methyltransferase
MSTKGSLFLIPNIIADDTQNSIVTPQLRTVLPEIHFFLAEDIRTVRRYLSSLKVYDSIEKLHFSLLNKDTKQSELADLLKPISEGKHVGVISESGCPGIADPGAIAVQYAHLHSIRVIPLTGPSSITLALMASGLNGQKFAFQGYLPIESKESGKVIKEYEKESRAKNQTQVFIETPYRNNSLMQNMLKNLQNDTLLTVAVNITGSSEFIATKPVKEWKLQKMELPKLPTVFLFLA